MITNEIAGLWRLKSWTTQNGYGDINYPFGQNAEGNIIYTPNGRVSVHLAAGDRPRMPQDIQGAIGSGPDQIAAYATYVAYSGSYHFEGDIIVHKLTMSLYPNWLGIELRRSFDLSGDRLLLKMPTPETDAKVMINELLWIREE